mgnify:CR=1 FL=1
MNALTLQIKKDSFQSILKGEQDIEHRYVYPSNVTRYVYFEHDGKRYKRQEDIPNDDKDVDVVPIKYDALVLINRQTKRMRHVLRWRLRVLNLSFLQMKMVTTKYLKKTAKNILFAKYGIIWVRYLVQIMFDCLILKFIS